MPYIHPEVRECLNESIDELVKHITDMEDSDQVGCLNYVIYRLAKNISFGCGYSGMSGVRAAMNDASDEFYRRIMVPYEELKIDENGDIT